MSKETLKLALEVIMDYRDEYGPWCDDSGVEYVIKALEEALKQEQGEPYAIEAGFDNGDGTYSVRIERYKKDLKTHKDWKSLEKLLYTTPQPKQEQSEPVACDGDFPEGFDSSFGIQAQALRAANSALFDMIGNRQWDVPCLAKHIFNFKDKK